LRLASTRSPTSSNDCSCGSGARSAEERGSMDRNPDPPHPPGLVNPERAASLQRIARAVLAIGLVLLGAWILHRFLRALVWAGVLAIALWPSYRRFARALPGHDAGILAPFLLTLLIGLIFTLPFVYVVVEGARESSVIIHLVGEAQRNGVPAP